MSAGGPIVRIGCAGLPTGVARLRYFEKLSFLETDATFYEPPRAAVLTRWRGEAPSDAAFAVLAWQLVTHEADTAGYARLVEPLPAEARLRVGSFRPTDEVRGAWRRTVDAARALRADVILLQTPPAFSPAEKHKDALRRFMGEVVAPAQLTGLTLAWEPRGVWEPAQAGRLAAELGLVYALDPLQLETAPPEGDAAYFRIYGLGLYRNKISDDHLELLAELASAYERSWVVFANLEKYPDAQRFRALWEGRDHDAGDDDDADDGAGAE